jgi:hypothetical protein
MADFAAHVSAADKAQRTELEQRVTALCEGLKKARDWYAESQLEQVIRPALWYELASSLLAEVNKNG